MTERNWSSNALAVACFAFSIFLASSIGMTTNAIVKYTEYQSKYDQNRLGKYVTLIGDSISWLSRNELSEALPGVDMEVKSGIQFSGFRKGAGEGGMERLRKHPLRDVIVYLLGSNNGVDKYQLENLRNYVGDKRKIVLMTIYFGDRLYESEIWNETIKDFVAKHDNIYFVDWYAENVDNPRLYLTDDLLHPVESGRAHFAKLVRQETLKALGLVE